MRLILPFIVFLVFLLIILVPAIGVGFLLSWIVPSIDLGMGLLIGVILVGTALHFTRTLIYTVDDFLYAMGIHIVNDRDDDDDDDDESGYPVVIPAEEEESSSRRRKRSRWPKAKA